MSRVENNNSINARQLGCRINGVIPLRYTLPQIYATLVGKLR